MEPSAVHKLSYGLFVLSAREGERDNGCIVNTVMQVTSSPMRISVAVNNGNLTRDMIAAAGAFNVSVLSEEADFALFRQFGYASGRDTDKFAGEVECRTANGVRYLVRGTNAVLSGRVTQTVSFETHTVFYAEVTEGWTLSDVPSMTYQYYFDHINPKSRPVPEIKNWVCQICGYEYDGDVLPEDFVCPLCKHGAADFALV
ncbi:MAG: flavin reductase [Clostridia bacterium]|nr:flavin reductase [Clostridia bacterium]